MPNTRCVISTFHVHVCCAHASEPVVPQSTSLATTPPPKSLCSAVVLPPPHAPATTTPPPPSASRHEEGGMGSYRGHQTSQVVLPPVTASSPTMPSPPLEVVVPPLDATVHSRLHCHSAQSRRHRHQSRCYWRTPTAVVWPVPHARGRRAPPPPSSLAS
jgi:hypothetical protein